MAQILETILTSLLQPDNAIIQQATAQLKEAFKDPLIIPALCEVLRGSQDPQIRQFAAVLLRRRLIKHWKLLQAEQQQNVKSLLIDAIQRETEHRVRYALAQMAAVILRDERLERWPQLLQFVLQGSRSDIPHQRQVALLVLRSALDVSTDVFRPHFRDLLRLFHQTLTDLGDKTLVFYTVQAVTSLVPALGGDETNLMRSLIPKLLKSIRELIQSNEVQACEAMEVFDELIESEVSIVVHHIAELVHFCLEVAANTSLSDNLRVKALSCISFLIKLKSKSILKHKLLAHIVGALFPIMCTEPPPGEMDPEDQEEEEEELEEEAEAETPKHYAVQVIDMLALHLPPEKLFPQLTPLLEPCLLSLNPYQRKAGLMCLAVLSEGCADHIRHKHLQTMLQVVCRGVSDDSHVVRNAALFALGQFSENLQPEISSYSETILPLLLGCMSQVDPARTAHLTKVYYALENFVENLGHKIEPYLPSLMDQMLTSLRSDNNRVRELSVSSIGAIANAAEELLLPYFPSLMESLKVHLLSDGEEERPVQIQCLDTLGVLVRTLGKDAFLPLAEDCCLLGLGLCDRIDDPDLRRCTYSLFAALSGILEDSISPHLQKMTTLMLLSLKSTEGVVVHYNENRSFMLFDDEEAEEDDADIVEEEDDPDIEGFSLENAYIDEKEDACSALGEIASNASASFLPYLDSCFQEVFKHIESPHVNVRKSAYEALGQFVCSMNLVCERNPSEANTAVLLGLLSLFIPSCLRGAQEDKERPVVMSILETLNQLLRDVKSPCVQEAERLQEVCAVIRAVLQSKTACQDPETEDEDDDEQQAELDSMLMEYAGEGVPLLAAAVGGVTFAPYFAGFLPVFLNKVKPGCSAAEKSFAVGTLAESVEALGSAAAQFVPRLFPVLLSGAQDQDDEVRSNSVFGLGVLAEHGGPAVHEHYPKLLVLLSSIIAGEQNARVLDNVCGAVCRMVLSHPEGVPIGQVFPVILRTLPLKDDFEENVSVFKCVLFLYESSAPEVMSHINDITRICAHVLGTSEINPDTEAALVRLLKDMAQRFPQDLYNAMMSLPAESAAKIHSVLGSV